MDRLSGGRLTGNGMLASLGHYQGVGRVWKFRIKGFVAWWVWRTYYLFQMPRWDRRLRMVLDWTVALFFRPDVTRVDVAPAHDQRFPGSAHDGPPGPTLQEPTRSRAPSRVV